MTAKERLDRHDREIAAIRKLLLQGMKMLVEYQRENREFQRENRDAIRELRAAQRQTDQSLKALIQRGSNGHTKKP